jgi:RHS repeat-associated protein
MWGTDLSGSMQGAGGVGGLLAENIASNGVQFVAYDGNGNVVALVSATNGTVTANYEYGPFGELIRATGPMAKVNPFMFQTEFYDWETGKYYVKNRFYDPSTGRFLNRDPLGDLSFLGTEMNRDKKHRRELYLASSKPAYLFVANDPCNSFDPLGLDVYKVTTSTLFWIPLHRQIIGDDGNGGCYILEFFGKKRCWYQGIGAGGYNFIAPGMLRVSHDSKTPAEDYIKRNEFSIVDTVETTGAYFYGAGTTAQSASVDSMLAKDADTWVDDSTYIFLFHDCGTLANNFLSHARAVLKASENSVPTGPPGSDPFYGAFDGGDFSP